MSEGNPDTGSISASPAEVGENYSGAEDDVVVVNQAIAAPTPRKKRAKKNPAAWQSSVVWSSFEKREINGDTLAFCTVPGCHKKGGYKCGSTTSPLLTHLRDNHPELFQGDKDTATKIGTQLIIKWPRANPDFKRVAINQASSAPTPPKKRAPKNAAASQSSVVWSSFEKREINGQELAFCTVPGCRKKAGYKCGSTTSPLLKHLRDNHPELFQGDEDRTATSVTRPITKWLRANPDFERLAIKWLVLHNMPLSTFDDEHFRRMICSLNPRVHIIKPEVCECLCSVSA